LAKAGAHFTHLTATVSGQNALAAADKTAFEIDFDEFNDDLAKNKFIPFITIGASFSFQGLGGLKNQADAVDAMAFAGWLGAVIEYMPQMRSAAAAVAFGTDHEKLAILFRGNGIFLRLRKTGPARARVVFVFR